MMAQLDLFLDRISMYTLVLGYLFTLIAAATVASLFGVVPFSPFAILYSTTILIVAAFASDALFSRMFNAFPGNTSSIITALILAAIVSPVLPADITGTFILVGIAASAMASKYLVAYKGKHIFNPAGFGAVVASFVFAKEVSWWTAGSLYLLPIIAIGGLMTARKIFRTDAFIAFAISALATVALLASGNPFSAMYMTLLHAPLIFMGLTMLTDPGTMPPEKNMRIAYGILVGIWFAPGMHIASFYFSPALALLLGNFFVFLVSPKGRHTLTLLERKEIATNTYELTFKSNLPLVFTPGQYMEWTSPNGKIDTRGNRRYLTIASAPHEGVLRIAFRIGPRISAFKTNLLAMKMGDTMGAGQLSGDFVLPKNPKEKVAFIAGGIGITPFRSMVSDMLRTGGRDAVLLYSNKTIAEIAYYDLLEEARQKGVLKTVYAVTNEASTQPYVYNGFIDAALIQKEIPDFKERTFYLSGPSVMVNALLDALASLGLPSKQIVTDYFPGY